MSQGNGGGFLREAPSVTWADIYVENQERFVRILRSGVGGADRALCEDFLMEAYLSCDETDVVPSPGYLLRTARNIGSKYMRTRRNERKRELAAQPNPLYRHNGFQEWDATEPSLELVSISPHMKGSGGLCPVCGEPRQQNEKDRVYRKTCGGSACVTALRNARRRQPTDAWERKLERDRAYRKRKRAKRSQEDSGNGAGLQEDGQERQLLASG